MEILNYLLVSLVVFGGMFAGYIIGIIAKGELKHGKKYLTLLEKFLFSTILLITIIFVVNSIWLSLIFIWALIYFFTSKCPYKDIVVYILFGIIFYLSIQKLFLLQASLIFIYGLPFGSLLYFEKNKIKNILLRYIWFIPAAVALFLVIP